MYHLAERKRNVAATERGNALGSCREIARFAGAVPVYTENVTGSSPVAPTKVFRHFRTIAREVRVVQKNL